ncbi:alanine racemase [Kribbella solani]|uniref:alanine racemase n=1 Tax=Kribbella solani TaxID=236067 RepID=UPI0029B85966|nr:alanine racemase [Kribbella solani]MDX3004237.1 alanine racemase [Kribbella solani]
MSRNLILDSARAVLARESEHAIEAYGAAIGRPVTDLSSPALILDADVARSNIATMAEAIAPLEATLRPHFKSHKSVALAVLQVESGARGLSAATVWEAAVLAGSGLDDIFVVNTVAGAAKMTVLAQLARDRSITIAIDDLANTTALSEACADAGSVLGVAVELNTGMDRAGVDTAARALELARAVERLPGLEFRGLTGYEGHCALEHDAERRRSEQRRAMTLLVEAADSIEAAGIDCLLRSAGGTATWQLTAGHTGISEIQAGSYVLMDRFHARMAPHFRPALTVLTTVVSAGPERVVFDAGSKSLDLDGECRIDPLDLEIARADEEHLIVRPAPAAPLHVGDQVRIVPGYTPSTLNHYTVFHVAQAGVVTDVWPVAARGPGHHGIDARPASVAHR